MSKVRSTNETRNREQPQVMHRQRKQATLGQGGVTTIPEAKGLAMYDDPTHDWKP